MESPDTTTQKDRVRCFRVADIAIDPASRTIRRGEEEIHVRPKTFEVLLHLIQNPDRVVTKEELNDTYWKDTTVSEDALVRCILEIRRLLGDDPKAPAFVKNVPKVGYRFIAPVIDEMESAPLPVEAVPATPSLPPQRNRSYNGLAVGVAIAAATALLSGLIILRAMKAPVIERGETLARWRLDGNAQMEGPHGDRGELRGQAEWPTGKLGSAMQLTGTDSYVEGKACGFPIGNAPRAVSAWIRAQSSATDFTAILDYGWPKHRAGDNFQVGLQFEGKLVLASGWGREQLVGNTQLLDGRFHHVAGTYDGKFAALYIDGVEDGRTTFPKGLATVAATNWRIGSALGGGTTFRGAIDDVRLYPHALSQHEVQALYRCGLGEPDVNLPGGGYYDLPVFPSNETSIANGVLTNTGMDFSGAQLRRIESDCDLSVIRGSNLGQNLRIRVELLVPGKESQAGPYFRARAAYAGDGLFGGQAAGYWVALWSTGIVQIRRLNPSSTVAVSAAPAGFDPAAWHVLESEICGELLEVRLDGKALTFDQNGKQATAVPVPPAWEGPPRVGHNDGAAGILFAAMTNRGKAGGQAARNLSIIPIP